MRPRLSRQLATPARGGWPASTISLAVHAVLLLLLSFFTLGLPSQQPLLDLYAPSVSPETVEEFQDFQIEPTVALEARAEKMPVALASASLPAAASLSDALAIDNTLAELIGAAAERTHAEELGNLLGTDASGTDASGTDAGGMGRGATASFFGTRVQGQRIVYVLDNSGGMRQGELETLQLELLRSVEALTPRQSFYVIFYSDALYPLFFPAAPRNFVRATEKHKKLLRRWLDSVEFCLGNVVDEAIAAALSIRPDAIYLLTDGDLDSTRDQRRMRFLLGSAGQGVPLHTVGMGTGETGPAATKLQQVAAAHGGTFRAVKISARARELAAEKQRPYRRNGQPGPVWGRSFAD